MRTKLILATVCILTLPLLFSDSPSGKTTTTAPAIAYAGHTTTGNWCECGTPGCLCDPGEEQIGNGASQATTDQNKKIVDQRLSPIRTREGFDFGTGVLVLALVLLLWTRLRI